jgi:hypothetical protein
MLEKTIEEAVRVYAKKHGYSSYKFTSPSNKSVPDRIFVSPKGIILFVEFKRKGGKLTPLQLYTYKLFQSHNANIFVIYNIIDGKLLIDKFAQLTPLEFYTSEMWQNQMLFLKTHYDL